MSPVAITVILGIVQLCLGGLGVYVSLKPPRKDRHPLVILGFILFGMVGIVLAIVQQVRNDHEQKSLIGQLNTIQRNTEQPPKVTVNVPPPTVQLVPATNDKATRRSQEALFVDCSFAVLPKRITQDRIYVLFLQAVPSGGGFEEFPTPDGEFHWTGEYTKMCWSCRVTNYMGRPVSNVYMWLPLTFYDVVRDESGIRNGKVSFTRTWLINIGKIDMGTENAFVFYVMNIMDDKIGMFQIPDKATFQFVGETTRKETPIARGQIPPIMMLTPREKH